VHETEIKQGGELMLDHNPHLNSRAAADRPQLTLPPSPAMRGDCRLASGQFLKPLHHTLASWHRHSHHGGNQVIIRFHNGYGAIISEYRLLEGIYEIAPLRFHGSGPEEYEFYFRSHVPDLTSCSDRDEMLRVCEQISQLLPVAMV
jgi:hypothetical protein